MLIPLRLGKRSEISWLPNLSGLRDLTGLNLQVVFER